MSKPNIINQILRDQATQVSLESLQEEEESTAQDLTEVDLISSTIAELVRIQTQVDAARGICRDQALALESLGGFQLPFPAAGFTQQPSQTGLRLAQEAIAGKIADAARRFYEMLKALFVSIGKRLFGAESRFARAKERIRRALAGLKPDAKISPEEAIAKAKQTSEVALGVYVLATAKVDFKVLANDTLAASDALENGNFSKFNLEAFYQPTKRILKVDFFDAENPRQLLTEHFAMFEEAGRKLIGLDGEINEQNAASVTSKSVKIVNSFADEAKSTMEIIAKTLAAVNRSMVKASKKISESKFGEPDQLSESAKGVFKLAHVIRSVTDVLYTRGTLKISINGDQDAN